MKPQRVVFGTPYTDQMYSAVTSNWNQIAPRPEQWIDANSTYVPKAHNDLIRRFLEETDAERFFLLEDDIAVQPLIAARIATHQADVVTGLYVARREPYNPLIYRSVDERGTCQNLQPAEVGELLGDPREHPIELCGTGMLSISRRVLETIPPPWFEGSQVAQDAATEGGTGHDFGFCIKARQAGFTVAYDSSQLMYGIHLGWKQHGIEDYLHRVRLDALAELQMLGQELERRRRELGALRAGPEPARLPGPGVIVLPSSPTERARHRR